MTRCRRIGLTIGLLCSGWLALSAVAAEAPAARYAVEILVFDHLDQGRNTPETERITLPAMPGEDSPQDAARKPQRRSPVTFYVMPPHPRLTDFQPLADAETDFDRLYARLQRLDAYRPLLQLGWTQHALPRLDAEPYQVGGGLASDNLMSGTITLYKGRYLHLEIDLERAGTAARSAFGDRSAEAGPRLVESRRIRGSNLQYFDHPAFGVIASIREIEPPEPDTGLPATASAGLLLR